MKEVSIEKLKLARAARIKVREHIQEAFSAVDQLDQVISKFGNRHHPKLDEIDDCVTNIATKLDFENGKNNEMLRLIDFYLENKHCSDEVMAKLEKEVIIFNPY